jgi:hypothetical protein
MLYSLILAWMDGPNRMKTRPNLVHGTAYIGNVGTRLGRVFMRLGLFW